MQISYLDEATGRLIDCHGEDAALATRSPVFKRWVSRLSPSIEVRKLFFQSVDVAGRGTPKERVLFIKFIADALDSRRRPLLPGIVVLRGNAVACLVVIRNQGKRYGVLVHQARLAIGDEMFEIPAGMQDDDDDPCGVVLRELEEETGLVVPREQVVALTPVPAFTSPGLLDEALHLYSTELDVDDERFATMPGRVHGCVDEHEHIIIRIVPIETMLTATSDLKSHCAYLLWERAQRGA